MMTSSQQSRVRIRPGSRRAFALVITLCAVVLLTVLVLAFFSRALLNRQISFSSTNLIKADMLNRVALDVITGEIRQEMADFSTVTGGVLNPLSSTNSLPVTVGVTGADANVGAYTISKATAAGARINPSPDGVVFGSDVLVTSASRNGRSISRWYSDGPQLGTANVPTWAYLTRDGAVMTDFTAGAGDPSGSNYVIGRFAYTVYNVGGLLDANVAGYPGGAGNTNASTKSSSAYADLAKVGLTQAQQDALVKWRTPIAASNNSIFDAWATGLTASTNATDVTAAHAARSGHLDISLGDDVFLSRRDLLKYFDAAQITNSVAGAMTHRSRSSTAPSWGPKNVAGATSGQYGDRANDESSDNRFIPGVKAFDGEIWDYADDGTYTKRYVSETDPLVTRKFSLAKLAWIGHDGPNAAAFDPSADPERAILTNFGLTWNSAKGRWDYAHGDANNILTLAEVSRRKRAPDFFELLKAGILAGSLGGNPGAPGAGDLSAGNGVQGTVGNVLGFADEADRHILQIGANMIDQADADNYPTAIHLAKVLGYAEDDLYNCVYGVENLPLLTRMGTISVLWPDHSGDNSPVGPHPMKVFLQPEVWNPHDSSTADPARYPLTPSQLRLVTYGACSMIFKESTSPTSVDGDDPPVMNFGNDPASPRLNGILGFKNPPPGSTTLKPFFDRPVLLTGFFSAATDYVDSAQPLDPNNRYKLGATKAAWDLYVERNPFIGLYLGTLTRNVPPDGTSNQHTIQIVPDLLSGGYLTFALEYKDNAGKWRPYSVMNQIQVLYKQSYSSGTPAGKASWGSSMGRSDPRTDRFSSSAGSHLAGNNEAWRGGSTVRSTAASNIELGDVPGRSAIYSAWPRSGSGFTLTPAKSSGKFRYYDAWAQNLPDSDSRYSDPDGATRPGDSWRAVFGTESNGLTDASGDGMMLYQLKTATNADYLGKSVNRRRPVILNRPFRSVGELGYVFRDQPFKTLDFWSENSADGGLLDLFSISEQNGDVMAGRLNPSAAPPAVLNAITSGAARQANASTNLLSAAESDAIVQAVITEKAAKGPLGNGAESVARLSAPVHAALTGVAGNNLADNKPFQNKTLGESAQRALAGMTDTRTWNLLIDVVAQPGRLARNATDLSDFIVEGERRYWLHVAVDRYTGKILSSQLEAVYE